VRDIAALATVLGIVSTVFDFLFFALYYRISPEVLQTNWFIASIITELAFLYSIRTRKFFLRSTRPAPIILWLSGAAFLATIILPFTAWGDAIFHFIKPEPMHIVVILGVVALYFATTETVKLLYYRYLYIPHTVK
jgi:Mg2+-importing ATPase